MREQIQALLRQNEVSNGPLDRPVYDLMAKLVPAPEVHWPPGTRMGPYEVISTLGAGGMGQVYRARDVRLGRIVALKVIRQSIFGNIENQRRFHSEARAVAALNHPNIVALFDIMEQDGVHFLVMEYVEGQTLKQRMTTSGLSIGEIASCGAQVAGALSAAHAAGIVHRDIKPGNIMMTPDLHVKVFDFGLAKLFGSINSITDSDADDRHTVSGMILGTPCYMSPEQTRGETLDGRSDVFSLGCVLYEAATGRARFRGPVRFRSCTKSQPPLQPLQVQFERIFRTNSIASSRER